MGKQKRSIDTMLQTLKLDLFPWACLSSLLWSGKNERWGPVHSNRTFLPAPAVLVHGWNPVFPSRRILAPSRHPTSSILLLKLPLLPVESQTLLLCAVSTDFPSIHIGFPVPGYSQRKSDSKGHLSGLQRVQWSLQPDKSQQDLAGPDGIKASSLGGSVDFTKRIRKFLQGHALESQPMGGYSVAR